MNFPEQAAHLCPVLTCRQGSSLWPTPDGQGQDDSLIGQPKHQEMDLILFGRLIKDQANRQEAAMVRRTAPFVGRVGGDLPGQQLGQPGPEHRRQQPLGVQPAIA